MKSWDIAAGMLLVREAGGRVCDFGGRSEKILDGGQIIAGGLKTTEAIQKHVQGSGYLASFAI